MAKMQTISDVVDLLDSSKNVLYNMSASEAVATVARGNPPEVAAIDGHFAIVARDGVTVRMCRTISRPMRYFIAKTVDGPLLVVADRIDSIHRWLCQHGMGEQFHPSYTRMVPAHYIVDLRLVGCPDPNPTYQRYLEPATGNLSPDLEIIGRSYAQAIYDQIRKWLQILPDREPLGVCFSGGIDSGAVFLLTYHALLTLGMSPARLKAFTLAVDGRSDDLEQARRFLRAVELDLFLEPIEVPRSAVDVREAIRIIEDYKSLDVEAAAVNLALLRAIRKRYPDWKYLLDGDGGDENLKDYPIDENPELTIRSVLNNRMLYQEGWGVDSIKHSLTYSGGQSRGYVRSYAPASDAAFVTLSPYTSPSVIAVAEAIPFIELTGWSTDRLYRLKGEIVSRGIRAITGREMPIYEKRRFQRGAMVDGIFSEVFRDDESSYRRMFHALYE